MKSIVLICALLGLNIASVTDRGDAWIATQPDGSSVTAMKTANGPAVREIKAWLAAGNVATTYVIPVPSPSEVRRVAIAAMVDAQAKLMAAQFLVVRFPNSALLQQQVSVAASAITSLASQAGLPATTATTQ